MTRIELLDDICHVCGKVDHIGCSTASDLDSLLAAARAEALREAMAECEAEAALCDSEKSGLDAGSAARNCRDRIEFALVKP